MLVKKNVHPIQFLRHNFNSFSGQKKMIENKFYLWTKLSRKKIKFKKNHRIARFPWTIIFRGATFQGQFSGFQVTLFPWALFQEPSSSIINNCLNILSKVLKGIRGRVHFFYFSEILTKVLFCALLQGGLEENAPWGKLLRFLVNWGRGGRAGEGESLNRVQHRYLIQPSPETSK